MAEIESVGCPLVNQAIGEASNLPLFRRWRACRYRVCFHIFMASVSSLMSQQLTGAFARANKNIGAVRAVLGGSSPSQLGSVS